MTGGLELSPLGINRQDAASVLAPAKEDHALFLAVPRDIDTDHQRIAQSGHQFPPAGLFDNVAADELHRAGARELTAHLDAHEVAVLAVIADPRRDLLLFVNRAVRLSICRVSHRWR